MGCLGDFRPKARVDLEINFHNFICFIEISLGLNLRFQNGFALARSKFFLV